MGLAQHLITRMKGGLEICKMKMVARWDSGIVSERA